MTDETLRVLVGSLPPELRAELARGPLDDPDDEAACRVCEVFDLWIYGHGPGDVWKRDEHDDLVLIAADPNSDAVYALVDWHREVDNGYSQEAARRCLRIYAAARESA